MTDKNDNINNIDNINDDFSHLKRFSSIRSSNNIKFLTPAVYSDGWCPMRVACNICENIEGLSYLLVGMPECAIHSRGMNSMPEGENGELRRLYTLDENEVIFGCRKGVIEALRVMDKEGSKAILMIATCVTDLIGEDFEGLIEEVQSELNAKLSFVTLGQFKNFGSPVGTWKTAEALGSLMRRRQKNNNMANALFIEPWGNNSEPVKYPLIVKAMEKRGVKIRKIARGASLSDYMNAPDSAMNLVLCSYTQPLAAKMKNAFDIQYAPLHNAYRVDEIDEIYKTIEDTFGINFDDEFGKWREKAVKLEERAYKELKGLKYVMLPGVDMPSAVATYLAGFGMEPIIMHILDLHNEDIYYAKKLKKFGYDPLVCRIVHIDNDIEIIQRLKPDISFGWKPDTAAEDFRCVEEMGDFFGIVGYERTAGLLERIFNVLETGKIGRRVDMHELAPL